MEAREKNEIIHNLRKYFFSKNSDYFFKQINLTKLRKINLNQKYSVKKITKKNGKYLTVKHALNLKSYLSLIVPVCLHKILPKCDFFYLIRGEEKETFSFFLQKGCTTAIVIRNKYTTKRFERFLVSYNKDIDKLYCCIYNIAGPQRMRHYELLLKLIYREEITKKLYKVMYPNRYFKQFRKTIKFFCDAQKIIIGYRRKCKKIIQKKYKKVPNLNIEDDYVSLSYYQNEKLLITGHVFGWTMKEILSLILQHTKIKQLFYIGNCGALNDLKVGEIVLPNNLFYPGRRKIVINNILSSQKYNSTNHLSVSTPFIETSAFVIKNRKKFSTVDVELYDIAKTVLNINRRILFGAVLLISDRPGRKENNALVKNEFHFQRSLNNVLEGIIKLALLREKTNSSTSKINPKVFFRSIQEEVFKKN